MKRASFVLLVCVVLFVATGFAATKKFRRNNRSRDWNDLSLQNDSPVQNDLSLQNDDPLNAGSGVSGIVGNLTLSQGGGPDGPPSLNPGVPDNWNGGTGNWNNAGNWSAGEPGANSDVTIYSGGNDDVTLNVGSTISSLALGGAINGTTSELTDNGTAQTLTITNGLTINATGRLVLTGGSTVSAGSLVNSDFVDIEKGSTLQINGNANNNGADLFTDNSGFGGNNTLNITGNLTNSGIVELFGAGDKATVGGTVTNQLDSDVFLYGAGSMATMGSLANAGVVDVEKGSTLQVNGDASNSGNLYADQFGMGGKNTINITGTLTNTGNFELFGPGDKATLGGLITSAFVDVENGSTLQINGNASNSADLFTDNGGLGGKNTLNITGNLTNTGIVQLFGPGDMATVGGTVTNQLDAEVFVFGAGSMMTMGSLNNAGVVDVENGSTLQVNGDVTNSGNLYTDQQGIGGKNTVNITGMLTNEAGGQFILYGPGDTATIGSVVNSGLIDLENNSNLTVTGDVNNSGNIYTSFYGGSGGNTITINGMLNEISGGQVMLFNPTDMLILNGGGGMNLQNGSTLHTPILNNGGTIDVDNLSTLLVGIGVLHGPITNYTQLANGTLGEMISATSFGKINVNGSALLDGTLAILLQGGFNPSVGSTYKFLNFTPGMLSGIFASIENDIFNNGTEKWFVDYENGSGYVELIAEQNGGPVPEPATLLVLIPGLLGAGYGLRRRLFT